VTGAADGIARAIALGLAREGADVAIGDIDFKEVEKVSVLLQISWRKPDRFSV